MSVRERQRVWPLWCVMAACWLLMLVAPGVVTADPQSSVGHGRRPSRALPSVGLLPSQQPSQDKRLRAQVLFEHGLSLYKKRRYQAALSAFQEAYKSGSRQSKPYLASCYRQVGSKYGRSGQIEQQRQYFKRALDLNPRLLDDKAFVRTYKQLQASASQSIRSSQGFEKRPPYKDRAFGFGLGLTLGVEGLLGLQVGALIAGHINPLVTFSPVLQSLDLTLRVIILRHWTWSPYVSAGIAWSLNIEPATNALQVGFPVIHATVGIHYVAPIGLTFATGLSLTYNFTPQTAAPFLPIPSVQFGWYF